MLGASWLSLKPEPENIAGVHSSVVRAADCRSAGPWFKSGCALSYLFLMTLTDQLRVCEQCTCRESSPGHKHGRLVCCRYTTGALTVVGHSQSRRSALPLRAFRSSTGIDLRAFRSSTGIDARRHEHQLVITSMLFSLVRKGYGSGFQTPAT